MRPKDWSDFNSLVSYVHVFIFFCLDGSSQRSPLFISAVSSGNKLEVRLLLDEMDLAGDIIQNLASHFKITELESVSRFPREVKALQEVCF
jgi:hypothetical protein